MKATKLCEKINKAFPEANAVTYDEWLGEEEISEDGIWFRSEGVVAPDGYRLFDYWEDDSYHPDLEALVEKHGFYLQPQDAGTLMAFRL